MVWRLPGAGASPSAPLCRPVGVCGDRGRFGAPVVSRPAMPRGAPSPPSGTDLSGEALFPLGIRTVPPHCPPLHTVSSAPDTNPHNPYRPSQPRPHTHPRAATEEHDRTLPAPRLPDLLVALLLCCSVSLATQSPWERAAQNLEASFTGPLAHSLAPVAIVLGGLMFMFGEGGAKHQISGIVFGGGLALFAAFSWQRGPQYALWESTRVTRPSLNSSCTSCRRAGIAGNEAGTICISISERPGAVLPRAALKRP